MLNLKIPPKVLIGASVLLLLGGVLSQNLIVFIFLAGTAALIALFVVRDWIAATPHPRLNRSLSWKLMLPIALVLLIFGKVVQLLPASSGNLALAGGAGYGLGAGLLTLYVRDVIKGRTTSSSTSFMRKKLW